MLMNKLCTKTTTVDDDGTTRAIYCTEMLGHDGVHKATVAWTDNYAFDGQPAITPTNVGGALDVWEGWLATSHRCHFDAPTMVALLMVNAGARKFADKETTNEQS
jgi:hypothetical protein